MIQEGKKTERELKKKKIWVSKGRKHVRGRNFQAQIDGSAQQGSVLENAELLNTGHVIASLYINIRYSTENRQS